MKGYNGRMALAPPDQATIVVVDDEERDRALLASILAPRGYRVECATNGREALALLDTLAADAIITDLRMPVMDGFELLRTLNVRSSFIPAIVLTSFGDVGHAVTIVHELQAF